MASKTKIKSSMFSISEATGCELITGNSWGDDYLIVEDSLLNVVEEILKDCGFPYVIKDSLPAHLRWAI